MQTLLAVDGNSLAHRAFHAYGPRREGETGMTNRAGRPVYATYGFLALLGGICDKVSPDAIVVGFDDHTSSVRKERCPEYKAQRESKGPELYDQLDDIRKVLEELGVHVVVPAGLEADDVVGSAARVAEDAGWRCVIATSDRDSFGLISESTTVMRLVSGLDNAVWVTPDKLVEMYGVRPDQYLDYAALRGDSSDNLVGVKGIGEKTAAKLLASLGTVRAALADLTAVEVAAGKACAKKLTADGALENYERNIEIMTILRDVEVDLTASARKPGTETVRDVLTRWELPNLVRRMTVSLCEAVPMELSGGDDGWAEVPPSEEASAQDTLFSGPSVPAQRPEPEAERRPRFLDSPDSRPAVTVGTVRPELWPSTLTRS